MSISANRRRKTRSGRTAARLALGLLCGLTLVAAAAQAKLEPIKVQPGDTLWSISQKYLKDPTRWNEILKHNKLPTSDPTVALPGITLQVPTELIKVRFRAAKLVQSVNNVSAREADKPAWDKVQAGRLLYHGDGLRTRDRSRASVEFHEGSLLSVDANSMVILKAPMKADHDIYLNRGAVHATKARVATPSAIIAPRGNDTKYTARVKNDLSTEVKVYKGSADVKDLKGLKSVVVNAGQATNISLDGLPEVPVRIPDMNLDLDANIAMGTARAPSAVTTTDAGALAAPTPGIGDAEKLAVDLQKLSIGMPVAAYHIQIARDRLFRSIVFDKTFDAYEKLDLARARVPNGSYWARVAVIDLLGDRGEFSNPRPYQVGGGTTRPRVEQKKTLFQVTRPAEKTETVGYRRYSIRGKADPDLTVTINGKGVPKDEDGNFSLQVNLEKGPNNFRIAGADLRGNDRVINRTIIYQE
ncbi:MAG: FecR domain-containing protein [Elusimicrobiota bacterium]